MFEKVEEIDFAEFLHSLNNNIEIIKIDIEGFEIELINHLIDEKCLKKINKIYLETHEKKFTDLIIPTKKLKERIKIEGFESKFFFDWH